MSAETLDWGLPQEGNASLSLEQLVSTHHIPIVPTSVARAHKQDLVDMSRFRIFRFFGPVLYTLSAGLEFFFNKNDHRTTGTCGFVLGMLVITIIGGFCVPDAPTTIVSIMQLAFWAIVAMIVIIFGHVTLIYFFPDYADASTIWERRPVKAADGYFDLGSVPSHLHDRIKRASLIPGAEVQIERFSIDPLVLVTRRIGLFAETVYIGGWVTGNPLIDDV